MILPEFLRAHLARYAQRVIASRQCDEPLGNEQSVYMERWWLRKSRPSISVYIHRFLRDDDDRALHDHRSWTLSIILTEGYFEHVALEINERGCPTVIFPYYRPPGSILFRKPEQLHRISLLRDRTVPRPAGRRQAVTLFITGPTLRTWGFACARGWIPWMEFVEPGKPGQIGKGCE